MKKGMKVLLILAAVFLIGGMLVIAAAIMMGVNVQEAVNHGALQVPSLSYGSHSETEWIGSQIKEETSVVGDETLTEFAAEDGTYFVDAAAVVDSVSVDWVSGSVTLAAAETDQISIMETSAFELEEGLELRYTVKDGELIIHFCDEKRILINTPDKNLLVLLPVELAQELKTVQVQTVSAECYVSGMTMESLSVSTVSGDIHISESTSGGVRMGSTSGEVFYTGNLSRLYVSTTSGSVNAEIPEGDAEIEIETTSGDIALCGDLASVDVDTTSGEVEIQCGAELRELDAETTSGDVTLLFPNEIGVTLEYETASGMFESELAVAKRGDEHQIGDGRAECDVSTVSGDLRIKAA